MKRGRSLEDVVSAALLEDTDEVPYTHVRSRNKKPRGAKGAKGKSSAIPSKLTNAIGSENDGNAKDPQSLYLLIPCHRSMNCRLLVNFLIVLYNLCRKA